jgi:hypothetical protein
VASVPLSFCAVPYTSGTAVDPPHKPGGIVCRHLLPVDRWVRSHLFQMSIDVMKGVLAIAAGGAIVSGNIIDLLVTYFQYDNASDSGPRP